MDKQVFNTVFEKLKLPDTLIKKFQDTIVEKICVNEEDSILNIYLLSDKIIKSRFIEKLEEELQNDFQYLDNISVHIRYDIKKESIKEKIEFIWEDLLFNINKISPLCHNVLLEAKWQIEDEKLIIKVKNNSSFFFKQKSIDKIVKKYLKSTLDEDVFVEIEDILLTEEERNRYEKDLSDKEDKIISDYNKLHPVSSVSSAPSPNKPFGGNPSGGGFQNSGFQKNNFRRLSSFKLNKTLLRESTISNMADVITAGEEIIVIGEIFELEIRETKAGKYLVIFDITDNKDSLTMKFFTTPDNFNNDLTHYIKEGKTIVVKGNVQNDQYARELNVMANEFCPYNMPEEEIRMDNEIEKRVELHLHTKMSAMDATNTASELVERAIKWGHKAIAITDHGVVQAFPDAANAARGKDIKVIYGVEAYLINDLGIVVESPRGQSLNTDYVVFDLETTGLHSETDEIIEVGAVRIRNGEVIDTFGEFINPNVPIPAKITKITGIKDSDVEDAEQLESVLFRFLEFIKDSVLVAHNSNFDMAFLRSSALRFDKEIDNTVVDTLELSRTLLPELNRHRLNLIAEHLDIALHNHHRAEDDAGATAEIFLKFIEMLKEKDITNIDEINVLASKDIDLNMLRPYHAIILAKNYEGLRNLYELISISHLEHFHRKRPRIPKSEIMRLREGLILGSACEAGEFYKAVFQNKPKTFVREVAEFYDYLEIQPYENNLFLFRNNSVSSIEDLIEVNKKIVAYGEEFNRPVVATCDVHFLDSHQEVFRKVIMNSVGFKDADEQPPLYFRTTEEMLNEFNYLGEKKAREVVIENTNMIADMIDMIKPIPDETFPPHIEGSEEQIQKISMNTARDIYGEELPKIVSDRLDKELHSIISNGFSVMYIIAQKLVWKSLEDGYLVGSRGSVGSSFVATMLGITEVNPLSPHYYCKKCKFSDFDSDLVLSFAGASGCDMPDEFCPVCGTALEKDGHDIPFETFLGFGGDKEPDIDLNFSGEYQAKAHEYTEELFGTDFVFKAGTIGTIAEKTAYGLVMKYFDEKGSYARNAEINRLRNGCTGVKRTTGQHPGGLMVVPDDHSIYEFTPIQRPANDVTSNIVTTHFDYHSLEGRLLKLDLLGHDVPTIIKYLHDTTGIDPRDVDLGDKKVISLFTSPEALGLKPEDINCKTGSLGLPEFGTTFVRQMLVDTNPQTFAELVRISGLSHGTDVWFNNAHDLIKEGVATLKEIIPTRDDIMVYLINKGVDNLKAFTIMEKVRKGKGVSPEEEQIMKEANVPSWYIESCKKIKYMFPKGHAVAYVMMTVRIGYFKIYYPYSFYGATFSVKADDFDFETMCQGIDTVKENMSRINDLGKDATTKEKSNFTLLEIVLEMYQRGLKFLPLDLYKSDAKKFIVTKEGLLPPLSSIQGLGVNAAEGIVSERENGEFQTVDEFRERTKTTKTVIEVLKKFNILKGIPDSDQLSLFS